MKLYLHTMALLFALSVLMSIHLLLAMAGNPTSLWAMQMMGLM